MTTIKLNKTFIIENCDTKKFITYRKKEKYGNYKLIKGLIGKKDIFIYILIIMNLKLNQQKYRVDIKKIQVY